MKIRAIIGQYNETVHRTAKVEFTLTNKLWDAITSLRLVQHFDPALGVSPYLLLTLPNTKVWMRDGRNGEWYLDDGCPAYIRVYPDVHHLPALSVLVWFDSDVVYLGSVSVTGKRISDALQNGDKLLVISEHSLA